MTERFTNDCFDILQEITNIAMGQAGSALAKILDTFVRLSVPNVVLVEIEDVSNIVPSMIGNLKEVTITRQAFYDEMDGEAFVIYGRDGCDELAQIMGYHEKNNQLNQQELLIDVTNILVGACLNSIAKQLETELSYTPPSIFGLLTRICARVLVREGFRVHGIEPGCKFSPS
ncbi:MAG: hypothetical protein GC154_19795 [bacterium]|nr:hypothetical protein [bacterium]